MKYLYILVVTYLLLLTACSEDSITNPEDDPVIGEAALILSVENAGGDFSSLETLYGAYRDEAEIIFADMFEVDKSELEGKSINEIIETTGEDWQIKTLKEIAGGYYKEIVVLTDETNTKENMVSELKRLNPDYEIDMIFCMHGAENIIVFDNDYYPLDELTDELAENDVEIRMIYQTNCHSKFGFDDWAKTNIQALNGAEAVNRLTIFSPQYFLENWIAGKNFTECVDSAYSGEIDKFLSYKDVIPVIEYVVNDAFLAGSKQYIGGSNPVITKDDYSKKAQVVF